MSEQKQVSTDAPAAAEGKWLRRGLLLAIVLGCAVAVSPNPADPDLWGHIQYGRDALADGFVPATTTYSFTAKGYRWINHENLAELLLAIGMDNLGPVGLLIAKCLLGLLVVGLILRLAMKKNVGIIPLGIVALLVAVNLAYHWSLRPHLLTYVYCALLMALLAYAFDGWEGRWCLPWLKPSGDDSPPELGYSSTRIRALWLAPVLFLFWANSHGGFVAGYFLYSAYLSCRAFEALACRGRAGWGLARRFVLMIVVAGLATLVNPYGPGLHRWLMYSLGSPRPEIAEWHAPAMLGLEHFELWLLIIVLVASISLTRRTRDFTHLVLLMLCLWQSLTHMRHVPFLAILFGFWMPVHVESLLQRLKFARPETGFAADMSRTARRVVAGGLILSLVLLTGRLYGRLSELRVDKAYFPVAATQFIADHELRGKLVVTYDWAQYAIGAFGQNGSGDDGLLVSFDGRFRTCYPQEVVDMNFDFVLGPGGPDKRHRGKHSPPFDPARVLEFQQPDLVLLCVRQFHSQMAILQHQDQWVLLYQDEIAQLWGRRAKYDDPASPNFIPPAERQIGDEPQHGYVAWPALPVRGRRIEKLASK